MQIFSRGKDCHDFCIQEEVLEKNYTRRLGGDEKIVQVLQKWKPIKTNSFCLRLKLKKY